MSVMPNQRKSKHETVEVSATHAVRNFADLINRAQYAGTRFLVKRNGKAIAALINPDDLTLLEHVEQAA